MSMTAVEAKTRRPRVGLDTINSDLNSLSYKKPLKKRVLVHSSILPLDKSRSYPPCSGTVMSTTTTADVLVTLSPKITISIGTVLIIAGVLGGFLSIVVFLSLRTFRESSCAFYLTIMSCVNIGNLLTGLLSRIIISGFGIDWTLISPFYCKFRWYCLQLCVLTSFTCVCLAAIDQYMATNARPEWRTWSNIKTARRITAAFILLWLLHGTFYLIYFNLLVSPTTGRVSCNSANLVFRQYHIYGYLIILAGIIPLLVTGVFGLLARNNVQQSAHRTVPLVQRELDKQLTKMVLVQIYHNFIVTLPYTTLTPLITGLSPIQDREIAARFDFANLLAILLYYSSFSVSVNSCFRFSHSSSTYLSWYSRVHSTFISALQNDFATSWCMFCSEFILNDVESREIWSMKWLLISSPSSYDNSLTVSWLHLVWNIL